MGRQLGLPLDPLAEEFESAMLRAWVRSGMRVPYQRAIRVPALAICLRNMVAAERRRKIRRTAQTMLHPEINDWTPETADVAETALAN